MPDVIIIGGGIAGLAAAFELRQRSVSFILLEQAAAVGGLIVSEQIDGFTIDGGPDALFVQKADGIRLCQEIGLGDRLVPTLPPRLAFVQRNGRLHPLPAASVLGIPTELGPFVRTGLFSWTGKLRMGAEIFVPRRPPSSDSAAGPDQPDESIAAFIRRRFGREAVTYLAEPLLAGIHAGDVERLSLGALFPRFAEAERKHGSLIRAFRRGREAAASPDGAFKSLPGGLGEIVRALVAVLPPGVLHTNAPATRIQKTSVGGGFRVDVSGGKAHQGQALIIATPAYVTSALLGSLDPDIAGRCSEIRYSSIATVALGFSRDAVAHPLNGSGYVVPRTEPSGILAATWLSSKWPHRAPEGKVLLRTFIGGTRDPAALGDSDIGLVKRSLDAIRPVLGIQGDPILTRVYRFERASAQHEVGHANRLQAIDRLLRAHPGLSLTGSGFRGVGIPDCVADARATAARTSNWLKSATTQVTERTGRSL